MEFGLFVQGYAPGASAHEPEGEHRVLMADAEMIQVADQNNFKFAWLSEHHALTEYSHLSANEVFAGYLAAITDRIHIGSGIMNLSPRINHPIRNAERVAMLDHLTNRRFEFGTGRGAGSHEVATFNIHDPSSTKAEWNEVIREMVRIWERRDYTFQGDHFAVDTPHNILPKPYGPGHPPLWVACGNPPTFDAAGELGLGVLAFTFDSALGMREKAERYKERIANCTEPVGQFKNDNIMTTTIAYCAETTEKARKWAMTYGAGYVVTLVTLYHDSFPIVFGPRWPRSPEALSEEMLDEAIRTGFLLCGTPDEVCEQLAKRDNELVDQLVFTASLELQQEEKLEIIELLGSKVIPEFDKDPMISTDRYRAQAKPKFGSFGVEPPPLESIWTNTPKGAPF